MFWSCVKPHAIRYPHDLLNARYAGFLWILTYVTLLVRRSWLRKLTQMVRRLLVTLFKLKVGVFYITPVTTFCNTKVSRDPITLHQWLAWSNTCSMTLGLILREDSCKRVLVFAGCSRFGERFWFCALYFRLRCDGRSFFFGVSVCRAEYGSFYFLEYYLLLVACFMGLCVINI